ncbi:MAG: hypothetical protein U9Q76_01715 [candidate division WOR-3 bacterium]|jgi:hypothetical protein|nr:hypothetical protein [candidate division WOR-3 bacterium]
MKLLEIYLIPIPYATINSKSLICAMDRVEMIGNGLNPEITS